MNIQVSEIEVKYKSKVKKSDRPKISNSKDVVNVLRHIWDDDLELVESFYCLILNRANEVIGYKLISKSSMSGTLVDPKVVFKTTLIQNGCNILVAHNHPSGNLQPSRADIQLTTRIKEGCELLDIRFLDHIILTDESHYSFLDNGLL